MQPVDCCRPPCLTVPPVNVPGTPGADAYTFTTANFAVPDIGSDLIAQVLNASGLVEGESVVLNGPAHFTVSQILSPTTVIIAFQGQPGDVPPGTVIQSGSAVVPTGNPGAQGAAGYNGYATVQSAFIVPSIGQTVTAVVDNSACFVVGEYVISSGPANWLVTAIPNANGVTLQFLGNTNDVAPGTTINPSSIIASTGKAGSNAYTTVTAQSNVPAAVGDTVTLSVGNTAWMAVGQVVVISGPSSYTVTTIVSATSVTLTWLGYIGDVAANTVIASGSTVSPSGRQPFSSSALASYASGTAAAFSGTDSQLTFGTNSPQLTLPSAGTWMIFANVVCAFFTEASTEGAVTVHLQRTNNTPGNVANSSQTLNCKASAVLGVDFQVVIPLYVYQTNTAGDVIQLWGSQTQTTTSATAASLAAYRIA